MAVALLAVAVMSSPRSARGQGDHDPDAFLNQQLAMLQGIRNDLSDDLSRDSVEAQEGTLAGWVPTTFNLAVFADPPESARRDRPDADSITSRLRRTLANSKRLKFTNWDGYYELLIRQRERDRFDKLGTATSQSEETSVEERLGLATSGHVYHANLMEFTLAGVFGLTQQSFEDTVGDRHRSSRDNGTLVEFDFDALILKRKKYPTNIYARRHRELEPRPFRSSVERTTTEFGLAWRYVSQKMPVEIRLDRRDVQWEPLGEEEEARSQINLLFQLDSSYVFSENNILSLTYRHESNQQEPFKIDYEVDDIRLDHELKFGDEKQHDLASTLRHFSQRGTLSLERTELREKLRLRHSESLRSWYQFDLTRREHGGDAQGGSLGETSTFLSANLQHQLYQSLVSSFNASLQTQEFDGGARTERFGVGALFDYRKTNRWGVLTASYAAALLRTDQSGGDQSIPIIDARRTFGDPDPIVLADPNIVRSSIEITSEDGTQLFQEGGDYRFVTFGQQIEVHRVPTGLIADGDTVLIDYRIDLSRSYTLDSTIQSFGIRQNFKFGLSPYYKLLVQTQEISPPRSDATTPEDVTAHTLGVMFQRGSFGALAEFEDRRSTLTPYEAVRLNATYSHAFGFGAVGSLSVHWSGISYAPPSERETEDFGVEGRYRHRVTRDLFVEGGVAYRVREDTLSRNDEGLDIDLSVLWNLRETEFRLTYEYGMFEDDFLRSETSAVFLQVRRSF